MSRSTIAANYVDPIVGRSTRRDAEDRRRDRRLQKRIAHALQHPNGRQAQRLRELGLLPTAEGVNA